MQAYQKLVALFEKIAHLNHLHAAAHWDEAVMMPAGAGETRAQALTTLDVMRHSLLVAPETAELLEKAKSETLTDPWQGANLRLMEREYLSASCIPADLLARATHAAIQCQQAWRHMRKENNWNDFLPLLSANVKFKREEAQLRGAAFALSPYDALLDHFSPGVTQALIDPIFAELQAFLPNFIQKVMEAQQKRVLVETQGKFPIPQQQELAHKIMETLGFDFNHGRLDVSHHPFCTNLGEDVRITTRYSEDSLAPSLMAVAHETGHALYEQHRPKAWLNQPVGHALGMSVHESQSLLIEMQACRSREFFTYLSPLLLASFKNQAAFDPENLYQSSITVRPSLIRVDADELTYPLHIILRYELEKRLIEGDLEVKDLPEFWDHYMQQALGISTAGNYRDGVMQDVHWPSAGFGYFPAYTLGRLIAAQLFHKASEVEPTLMEHIAEGDFVPLVGWLNEHVYSKVSLLSMDELLREATGESLSAKYFIEHVHQRYAV
ncbi:MAG TPA: carboxypeptidase M32 [Coxiellaceae bacterium]|nr:carboxypeptidase M32 [Coxiellaceae bacterium]